MLPPARHAIVDIGSNSIRLVIFCGSRRKPKVLYDDKLMAGLGRGVVARGRLDKRSMDQALATLRRFSALLKLVEPDTLQVVATAAVRDAANDEQFLAKVRALGLPVQLLSGEQEARASAWGVIASHPGTQGLVADLGGGSLELARIGGDKVYECASFRFGIMPVAAIRAGGRGMLRTALKEALSGQDWLQQVRGEQVLLVGGAWRALDKLRAHLWGGQRGTAFPTDDARMLKAVTRDMGPRRLAAVPGISSVRAAQLGHAAALLWALIAEVGPGEVIVSNAGLREGLLFKDRQKFST
jgi:exopolyphosphatase/guanosine-5'-triphosphate,3'-diphosphate pyrophosphatase